MNNLQKFQTILNAHSIESALVDGRLYAEMSYTKDGAAYDEWQDVTNFTKADLYNWLGY